MPKGYRMPKEHRVPDGYKATDFVKKLNRRFEKDPILIKHGKKINANKEIITKKVFDFLDRFEEKSHKGLLGLFPTKISETERNILEDQIDHIPAKELLEATEEEVYKKAEQIIKHDFLREKPNIELLFDECEKNGVEISINEFDEFKISDLFTIATQSKRNAMKEIQEIVQGRKRLKAQKRLENNG